MIPYARLTPGAGFQPDRALLYYAQRLVTHPAPRRAIASLIATGLRCFEPSASHSCGATSPEMDGVLDTLARDGVSILSPLATRPLINRMRAYFLRRPVIGPDGWPTALNDLPANSSAAAYDLATVVACPGVMALVNDPEVIAIASKYLGCKPTISSLGVRWSFPVAQAKARFHHFHRDVDDLRGCR